MKQRKTILALAGGVGGAKLALGLSKVLAADELSIVANTADDFEHLGLNISPDLDTLMYTLAELNNREQGWGLVAETWSAMSMLRRYGVADWFQLGDQDLTTHVLRTQWLREGATLTEVTARLCESLGLGHRLLPMSDDLVQTRVETSAGELAFQDYFVRQRCEPRVSGFRFEGVESATPQAEFLRLLASPELTAVIICPSNPFVSIAPILSLNGIESALRSLDAPVIAVSPIVAGQAIKGPAAKMMQELNWPVTSSALAASYCKRYEGLLDGFIIDSTDADECAPIRDLGVEVEIVPTIMTTLDDRIALANDCLQFVEKLR